MALPDTSLERFLLFLLNTKAEQTARKYHQAAQRLLEFMSTAGISIERLPPNVLHVFAQHLIHNKGLSAGSAKVFVHGARAYLNWLRTHDGQDDMTIPGRAEIRQDGRHLPTVLSPIQLKAFISLASRQREPFRTALMLLPYTGLRASEMTTLGLVDIKTANTGSTKHIVLSLDPYKTKGNKARIVPILKEGDIFLVTYLKTWRAQKKSQWLFPSPYDPKNSISIRSLSLYVKKIAERIKAPSLSPHTFRRIYVTTLHRQGVDLATISRIVGHSSMQTTRDHYLAIEADELAGRVAGIRLVPKGDHADKVEAAKRRALDLLHSTRDDRLDIPDVPDNLLDLITDDEDDAAE